MIASFLPLTEPGTPFPADPSYDAAGELILVDSVPVRTHVLANGVTVYEGLSEAERELILRSLAIQLEPDLSPPPAGSQPNTTKEPRS